MRLLQNTLNKPEPCHFALVLGASGSGKSSLARAGVLPLLTRPGVIEGIGLWRCAIVRPSDDSNDLFLSLASALLRNPSDKPGGCPAALPELADPEAGDPQQSLGAELRAHPQSVANRVKDQLNSIAKAHRTEQSHALEAQIASLTKIGRVADVSRKRDVLQQLQDPKARLILLLDQMEELFTLNYAPEQLRAFLETIDVLARCGRVFVIATLRSDFYHRFQNPIPSDQKTLTTLVDLARDGARFDLLPPTPDEISQIIRSPARLAGLEFEPHPTITEHTLADTLRDEALADPESLPLLEHVLNRLYEAQLTRADGRLTFTDHTSLGGVGGALGKHAEDIFTGQNLKPNEPPPSWSEDTFHAVFGCLVTFGKGDGDADVPNRRAFAYDDLIKSEPTAQALVDTFIHERLFTADKDAQSHAIVRLSHEALLTRWPRLSQWLQTAPVRDLMSQRRRIELSLGQWLEMEKRSEYLLPSGFPLEEAKTLLKQHELALRPDETEFIRLSKKFHESNERRHRLIRQTILASLVLLLCAACVGVLVAVSQRNKAKSLLSEASRFDLSTAQGLINIGEGESALLYFGRAVKNDQFNESAQDALWLTANYGQSISPLPEHSIRHDLKDVVNASFSPDGKYFLIASGVGIVRIFDSKSLQPFGPDIRTTSKLTSAAFSPDGLLIITSSADDASGFVEVWEVASRVSKGTKIITEGKLNQAGFSPDSRKILTAGKGDVYHENIGVARVWDLESGLPISPPIDSGIKFSPYFGASFNLDGTQILTVSSGFYPTDGDKHVSGGVQIWDAKSFEPIGPPMFINEMNMISAHFSPDGSKIITLGEMVFDETGFLQMWDTTTQKQVNQPVKAAWRFRCANFSPDGLRFVTGDNNLSAVVWNSFNKDQIGNPMRHDAPVKHASFHPNGGQLLTVDANDCIQIWGTKGAGATYIPAKSDSVNSPHTSGNLAPSTTNPDGTRQIRVFTDARNQMAYLEDAKSGQSLGPALRHPLYHPFADEKLSAFFGPKRNWVTTHSSVYDSFHRSRLWNSKASTLLSSDLVEDFASFLSGTRLVPQNGTIERISVEERLHIWKRLEPKLGTSPDWLFVASLAFPRDATSALISHTEQMTVRDASWILLNQFNEERFSEVLSLDPLNPVLPFCFATLADTSKEGIWLLEYGFQHVPQDMTDEIAELIAWRIYSFMSMDRVYTESDIDRIKQSYNATLKLIERTELQSGYEWTKKMREDLNSTWSGLLERWLQKNPDKRENEVIIGPAW